MIRFSPGDVLLIVDVQNDFLPDGALHVPEGDKILPVVNELIDNATKAKIPLLFSRDWHPKNHCSFKENGGIWPAHCVQNTPGAAFHSSIHLPDHATIINKAFDARHESYSAFEGVSDDEHIPLPTLLKNLKLKRLFIAGLALDYCVKATALGAIEHGIKTHIITAACRAIDPKQTKTIKEELGRKGVSFD